MEEGEWDMVIKIAHLYYDLMNLYGEYGNLKILEHHLKEMNQEVIVDKVTVGDSYSLSDYDFIYMGSGTEKNQLVVLQDFILHKEELKKYIDSNKFALFTGNSLELLGSKVASQNALGVLNFHVTRVKERQTADVILKSDVFSHKVVGFINKMAEITNNSNPLFKVEFGIGENANGDYEGIHYKNCYGTYVLGPLLVRNPYFLQDLIKGICLHKNKDFVYEPKEYANDVAGYELVLAELEKRKKEEGKLKKKK